MSTRTPNLNLINPAASEKGVLTTYLANNNIIDTAYGQSSTNLAPVEGNISSGNYSVGSYLINNGVLCKVTSAIAVGEEISDSNTTEVSLSQFLEMFNVESSNYSYFDNPRASIKDVITAGTNCRIIMFSHRKYGKIVNLFVGLRCLASISSGEVMATLYSGLRPSMTAPLVNINDSSKFSAAYEDGTIKAKASFASGYDGYFIGSYIIP